MEILNKQLIEIDIDIERTENNIRVANLKLTDLKQSKVDIEKAVDILDKSTSVSTAIDETLGILEKSKELDTKIKVLVEVDKAEDVLKNVKE